jgi:N-acetylneuraminic acid mutarotase
VILFGGADDNFNNLGDTWAYDPTANAWTALTPGGGPISGRAFQSTVYDSAHGKVILFGGGTFDVSTWSITDFGDTWAYDPTANTWTNLHPSGDAPSARDSHGMVYNSATGKVILFGGEDTDLNDLNDTWSYDPVANTWTNLHPASVPPARDSHAMAYDSATGKVILFGGYRWNGGDDFDDTWAYDSAANTWTNLHPTNSPSARDSHSMVYSPATGKVVLFGGAGADSNFNDTWAY